MTAPAPTPLNSDPLTAAATPKHVASDSMSRSCSGDNCFIGVSVDVAALELWVGGWVVGNVQQRLPGELQRRRQPCRPVGWQS